MAKVVAIIEGQVAETAPDTSGSRRSGSMALLAQLKRESSRLLPDLTTFRSHANELIALLAPPNRLILVDQGRSPSGAVWPGQVARNRLLQVDGH